ncbi:MAG: peptidoglycan-binding protein [Gammaproteobacteria bacterium]|jgi:peptidoglycan hydrolase-like protein with peptidoglycan-binding domain|nr:peptidoglycan-binding protein [Gammaproteobacteria bacterium]
MSAQGLPTIKSGSRGPYVSYCQNLLNVRLHGQACLWVDGIFGPKTDAAVRHYQGFNRLERDGVVGPLTWGALEAGPPPIKKRPSVAVAPVPASGGL